MGYEIPKDRLETRLKDKHPLYTRAEAITEANRCIYCSDAPCVQACPTGIDIPTFIHKIATDNVRGSARTIFRDNLLGYSCARVCPVEVLCAGSCVYNHWDRPPIEIGRLQRYATENALVAAPDLLSKNRKPPTGKKIALIGAGPASLAAAGHLALDGHKAVIFDKNQIPGGLNTLGIAPYKLQADDAVGEVEFIEALGDVEIRTGVAVVEGDAGDGEVSTASLLADYDAVFIGIGLGPDNFLADAVEEGEGVEGATDLIARIKIDPKQTVDGVSRALVLGGGNTAIDIA
ncbi:MAG: FAD-dependent oxidoreductase, partial [Deltaproteobacteria bacterium]|nr:FAD-dependent oxidoreductase [Deltaproteobacteria bacterium]